MNHAHRIFYKFESEKNFNTLKFNSHIISIQEIRQFLERKKKINFTTEKVVFWNTNKQIEVEQGFVDSDTYMIFKRVPMMVPNEIVHIQQDEDEKEEERKLNEQKLAQQKLERDKIKNEENQQTYMKIPVLNIKPVDKNKLICSLCKSSNFNLFMNKELSTLIHDIPRRSTIESSNKLKNIQNAKQAIQEISSKPDQYICHSALPYFMYELGINIPSDIEALQNMPGLSQFYKKLLQRKHQLNFRDRHIEKLTNSSSLVMIKKIQHIDTYEFMISNNILALDRLDLDIIINQTQFDKFFLLKSQISRFWLGIIKIVQPLEFDKLQNFLSPQQLQKMRELYFHEYQESLKFEDMKFYQIEIVIKSKVPMEQTNNLMIIERGKINHYQSSNASQRDIDIDKMFDMSKLNFIRELCLLDNSQDSIKKLVSYLCENMITRKREQIETFDKIKNKQQLICQLIQNQPSLYELAQGFKNINQSQSSVKSSQQQIIIEETQAQEQLQEHQERAEFSFKEEINESQNQDNSQYCNQVLVAQQKQSQTNNLKNINSLAFNESDQDDTSGTENESEINQNIHNQFIDEEKVDQDKSELIKRFVQSTENTQLYQVEQQSQNCKQQINHEEKHKREAKNEYQRQEVKDRQSLKARKEDSSYISYQSSKHKENDKRRDQKHNNKRSSKNRDRSRDKERKGDKSQKYSKRDQSDYKTYNKRSKSRSKDKRNKHKQNHKSDYQSKRKSHSIQKQKRNEHSPMSKLDKNYRNNDKQDYKIVTKPTVKQEEVKLTIERRGDSISQKCDLKANKPHKLSEKRSPIKQVEDRGKLLQKRQRHTSKPKNYSQKESFRDRCRSKSLDLFKFNRKIKVQPHNTGSSKIDLSPSKLSQSDANKTGKSFLRSILDKQQEKPQKLNISKSDKQIDGDNRKQNNESAQKSKEGRDNDKYSNHLRIPPKLNKDIKHQRW
eukprot:403368725